MDRISRRDFFKLSGLALGSLAFNRLSPRMSDYEDGSLARVCIDSVSVYSRPDDTSRIVSQWYRDDIVHVYEEVNSGTPGYNPIWYRVWGGFMHRAHLQKVKFTYNKALISLPKEDRQLGQVTVPYAQAIRYDTRKGWVPAYRLYYDSVHWITDVTDGPDGKAWYVLLDELLEVTYNVPAEQIHPVTDDEIAPISPGVPMESKRIEVSLDRQRLTAYEYDNPIFEAVVSSGIPSSKPGDNGIPTITPSGRFNVVVKMPSKHMGEGNLAGDINDYVLPGVPWCCFFTGQGHATHGAWWHDNFGVPMSHGCINMHPEDAKWVFRWARPIHEPADVDRKGVGTTLIIK
jgi:lipoprotein-anchoring transpeptidase ErfK/SrfK